MQDASGYPFHRSPPSEPRAGCARITVDRDGRVMDIDDPESILGITVQHLDRTRLVIPSRRDERATTRGSRGAIVGLAQPVVPCDETTSPMRAADPSLAHPPAAGNSPTVAADTPPLSLPAGEPGPAQAAILCYEVLLESPAPDELLDRLCRIVEDTLPGRPRCFIAVAIDDRLRIVAPTSCADGLADALHGIPIAPGNGTCAAAASHGTVFIASDVASDRVWSSFKERLRERGIRATASFPLIGPGSKPLGALGLYFGQPTEVDETWQRFLMTVARVAAHLIACQVHDREQLALTRDLERRLRERDADNDGCNATYRHLGYAIAHEFCGPIRAITALSELLAGDSGNCRGIDVADCARRLNRESRRLDRLVHGMLDLAASDHRPIERVAVNLSGLARMLLLDLAEDVPDRQVGIEIEPGVLVQADPVLMRIVMRNLLSNAWKYTRKTAAPKIAFGARRIDGIAVYFVRDNGVGFDPAKAEALFQPFERLPSARSFEGSGIGLSTVRRIIQRHGGKLWFEAAPELGATFYFSVGDEA